MERKVFGGGGQRVAALCLALVLGFGCLSVGATAGVAYAATASRAAYTAEEFEITQDGVTYSCETTDKGTAEITGIVADDSVTAVSVPSSIEHGGPTYKVTKLYFSSGIVARNVEQLTLPDTLEKMYGGNFRRFAKVKELHIPGSIKNFGCSLQNAGSLEKLYFDEGVEEISANMMVYGCSSLSEIDLPSTLKMISGSGAFEGATALTGIEFPKDVAFSDTITGVFEDCTSLTSVSLPASVTKIPSHMFDGCTSLTSVTALSEIESIGDGAFRNCSSLTGVDFPGTLKSIGSSAFQGCASLVSVPDLSKVTKMGSAAFRECGNLRASVDLSSLQSVPGYAFCYTPVKIVGLCDSLKSIGDWAFIWSNVAVQLPETLEKIGNYAFFGGTLPEQLSIPDSVTSVGKAAFSGVDGVRDVTIGRGLTNIPKGMFDDSTVQKITIENSMDDITGSGNLPSSGIDIVYTRESIDDGVGDTVSDDSTKTLQQLVNEAPVGEETIITLKKHVKLGSTLTVPAGKMIKIRSDKPYTILAKKSGVSALVNVAERASLELSGKVSLRGRYNKGAIISSKGAVVLSDEAVVYDGTTSSDNAGAVDVSGDKASLTMKGGVIEQCELRHSYCGAVRASSGAHVVMRGGVIRNNGVVTGATNCYWLTSSGVILWGDARFDMSGGSIEGNNGYRGSAVLAYGQGNGENQRAKFTMTGGQISGNRSSRLEAAYDPSGAVHIEGNAEFTMTGGEIKNNVASGNGKGGGVCVVDPGCQGSENGNTAFTMQGGSISGNSASAGGGVYTYSNDVTLSAGKIEGNTAWSMGGGVYSEGNEYLGYSTLRIENALVVDNHAVKQGGGMWFCPTGDAKVYVQDGGLIAKNTADEAGDDFVFTGAKDAKYKLTLANRAPGGGKVSWYRDGGLFNPEGTTAATNPKIPRFTPDGDNGEPLSFTDATPNVALKSVMSEDVYNLGGGQTSLTISGNTAPLGGGIGANGGVVIGKSENINIPVKKVWENPKIPHPNKVKVNLKNGDTVIDSITLSESDGWEGVFSNLPQRDASGSEVSYTVAEDAVEGYSSKVAGDAAGGFTVTNTSTAKVSVPVEKKWVGPAASKATVRLLADGKDTGKSIDLTESNSWKGSFEGLPKYSKSGSEVSYTVAEDAVEGYSSKVAGDAAGGFTVTNTSTAKLDYSARAGVRLSKTLSGRAMEAGQFAFTVAADAETAAKLGLKTDGDAYAVAAADDGKADLVDLVGGAAESDVKFTDADAGKTYSFTVTETKLGGEGYTNDTAPRTVTIAPGYDAATGKLTVTTTVAKDGVEVARSEVSTADDVTATPAPVTVAFQNSYEATGTLGGEGNVAINATKTLTGRAAAADEFSFSVRDARGNVVATASNRASGDGEAAGLAFSPIAYTTDALEQMVADGIATRAADGSWAIPYTVSEDGTDRLPAGVTATASSFDITVKVTDDGKGGLDVSVVYPEGSGGTLSFVNGYGTNEATVDLAGTKTLALGQAWLDFTQGDIAGKYTFKIAPLDGAPAPADASGKTVTEATNDAAGNVELGSVTFRQPSDLDDVEIDGDGLRTKTFAYRVSESGSVDGVVNDATATRTFTVRVVEDTAAGTLAAEVLPAEGTPEGKGAFEFTNTYVVNPTPSSVTDQIKVGKKLKGRDLAEGEFEFHLVEIAADGSESVAATGRNAADGTVALGPVAYTAPGTHSYELREVAGTAGGVTYDKATYLVRTTVTDAKNGTLTIKHELVDAEGNAAGDTSVTFTNGYEAAPVTLKLGAAKVLKGAGLKAGQFGFELKSRDGKVMSTARNAADGSVTFDALTFKQAGTYTFTVSEVDDGQAHVTYDKAVHKIVVTVGDEAADGTKTGYLSAKVSYEGDANIPPVFTNSYAENPGTPGTPENPGTPGGGSDGGSDNGSGSGSNGDGSKGGMPDTGDRSLPVEALGAMAGIGALAAAGGAVLYRRRR